MTATNAPTTDFPAPQQSALYTLDIAARRWRFDGDIDSEDDYLSAIEQIAAELSAAGINDVAVDQPVAIDGWRYF